MKKEKINIATGLIAGLGSNILISKWFCNNMIGVPFGQPMESASDLSLIGNALVNTVHANVSSAGLILIASGIIGLMSMGISNSILNAMGQKKAVKIR